MVNAIVTNRRGDIIDPPRALRRHPEVLSALVDHRRWVGGLRLPLSNNYKTQVSQRRAEVLAKLQSIGITCDRANQLIDQD